MIADLAQTVVGLSIPLAARTVSAARHRIRRARPSPAKRGGRTMQRPQRLGALHVSECARPGTAPIQGMFRRRVCSLCNPSDRRALPARYAEAGLCCRDLQNGFPEESESSVRVTERLMEMEMRK